MPVWYVISAQEHLAVSSFDFYTRRIKQMAKNKTCAYQLHQLKDTRYGLEISRIQPDAGQGIRLTWFRLHRRYLPRIIAGVVAGTIHRHYGLRHHITPIRTLRFSTLASTLGCISVRSSRSERQRGVNRWGSKMENRTGIAEKPIARHLLYVHHGPCAQRLLPLRITYSINSLKSLSILSLPLCYIASIQHSAGSIDEIREIRIKFTTS